MCTRRELNILAKVIENIGFGSEPERDSRPLSFSMKGMVFFLAFFLSFFILCLRSSPGLPYPSRSSSTKPPHSQPSFFHSFPANYNFPSPTVSKISLSHRSLCLSSLFSHVREAFQILPGAQDSLLISPPILLEKETLSTKSQISRTSYI